MKLGNNFSHAMHLYTEKPGQLLPVDAHRIIKHRYEVATKYAQDKSVLEIGLGQAIGSKEIAKVASSYVGGEYSNENIDVIKNKNLNQKIVQLDAHLLPFPDAYFELVIALAMIYYLDFDVFLEEIQRILKKEGKLLFCASNKDVPGFVPAPFTTQHYSIPELNEKLTRHDFQSTFYGAFPRFDNSANAVRLKVIVRDIIKSIIPFVPYGDKIWSHYRNKALGGLITLPDTVEEIKCDSCWDENFVELPDHEANEQYRIIYCVAQR